ncbi:tripartite tricarboxylate transporter substrate binding protein [Sinorhizobium meliloti]|jgi:putative tricarboxylic transport membrane protein|uniref:Bug family tripartite tricarboxylate transporter substrate binding protein n=1 Tax=Rhizobium meliloti TaxID=382 RepID=UPI000B496E1B|nr:tripartite tricarboxylate transporter substrate-binding protein [Sinorhizobium meliloti]ASP73765.1 C4-dicarboxylate ABC transporter substrate-binding protein [Sinorhizobium meliloti]MDE3858006.1 tripartite tricarboxylate transporter substrate binding protein [Sinorhizobium meliloti]MDW9489530.1 tripartite tricarboxylate transporter substrate binding protein [Sinorhizobium meliloti]MDW9509086.1 tripartite tricarboxylate transporter substrate binding protein [Sinorhizobium meliloti]MDW9535746
MRRNFVRKILGFGLAAAVLTASFASATVVGAQELELTVTAPAGAGGGWDSASRSLQEVMMATGNAKSVQVVNVPGAGGTVGLAQFVGAAKGSSDQLLVAGITLVGASISNNSPVDLTQVTPIARLTGDPLVIVVPKDSPIRTIADLQATIKEDVAKTIWVGGSAGGADHILAALVTQASGEDPSKINYVAYSGGGEALAAMLGGQATAGVSGYGEWQGQIESGDLRALAISYPDPIEGIEAKPLKAQGLDIELVNWRGVFAGPGVEGDDLEALKTAVDKTVKSPEWQAVLKARGWTDYYAPAEEFKTFIGSETERVRGILKSVGLAN